MEQNQIYKVRNPRTGQYDYEINILSAEEVKGQCDDLRNRQQQWFAAGVDKRIEALQQWKASVEKYKQELIDALCTDTGRKWETVLEVDLVAASIDRWCRIAKEFFQPPQQKQSSIPFIKLQQDLVPFQLVGVISPWNFPLLLSLIDTIPALLAGCAVMVKPSEVTPRFIKTIQASLNPSWGGTLNDSVNLGDVLKYVEGDGSVGAAIVNNCDLICFTGSTATGKKVYDAASKKMIPVFLELGGKDPAIVLEGADLDLASSSILWGSTANAGQSCLSIERVYVQETVYDEFIKLLVAKASQIKLNAADINEGQVGPIIFEKQVQIINEHLKDAIAKGAAVLYGDEQCREINGGYYCRPTILGNVNHGMKIMTEETFGPVIPVMKFGTKEEAIALANDTIYGLSAAVFAKRNGEAMELGNRIEGGAISINDCALTAVMHEGEKNSFKLSGIGGTRMGPAAIKRFMRQKVFIIKDGKLASPWWPPQTPPKEGL
jgi:succinate-semialdehyde dehydrogenase / glutarate-semialdehyde dehydrogenase